MRKTKREGRKEHAHEEARFSKKNNQKTSFSSIIVFSYVQNRVQERVAWLVEGDRDRREVGRWEEGESEEGDEWLCGGRVERLDRGLTGLKAPDEELTDGKVGWEEMGGEVRSGDIGGWVTKAEEEEEEEAVALAAASSGERKRKNKLGY